MNKQEREVFERRNIRLLVSRYINGAEILNKKFIKFFSKTNGLKNFLINFLTLKFKIEFWLTKKPAIPNLDFMITTVCTLKCEKCCSLMPDYNEKSHYIETFCKYKENFDNLMHSINYVGRLQFIGGEPLLNKDLPKMLEYAAKSKKVKAIVIITNGTIIPNQELINICRKYKNKVRISISDYRSNTELKNLKTQDVHNAFKQSGAHTYLTNDLWYERGEIKKENRNVEELIKAMSSCWQYNCPIYLDGEMHLCSRSVAIKRIIDNSIKDYVTITKNKDSSKDIIKLFSRDYVDACDYCHTDLTQRIPRAIQAR